MASCRNVEHVAEPGNNVNILMRQKGASTVIEIQLQARY